MVVGGGGGVDQYIGLFLYFLPNTKGGQCIGLVLRYFLLSIAKELIPFYSILQTFIEELLSKIDEL